MTRENYVTELDRLLKLVRTEYGFTQEVMARVLGISKKTLVEIEKGRTSLGWMGAAAFGTIFSDSQVLGDRLGGEVSDMVFALAFQDTAPRLPRTLGGRVWWREVERRGDCRIQQNIISHHYRALEEHDGRVCSSFHLEEVRKQADAFNRREEP